MPLPRTRSHSNGPRRVLKPQPTNDEDIIVISSDDDDGPPVVPKKRSPPKKVTKQYSRTKTKAPVLPDEAVVDISSDEEGKRKRSSRTVEEMEKQIKKLKEENERLKQQQEKTSCSKPSETTNPESVKLKALLTTLDDTLCCDICAGKMWTPATLACGHTFCQRCLQDWFSTAHMKHLAEHPNYTLHTPRIRQILPLLRLPQYSASQKRALLAEARIDNDRQAHPDYTCPACRVAVKSAPVNPFCLKAVVGVIGDEMGEKNPDAERQPQAARGRANDGPWDGFFLNLSL